VLNGVEEGKARMGEGRRDEKEASCKKNELKTYLLTFLFTHATPKHV